MKNTLFVIPSGNVTLHPITSGEAATVKACPERADRVEREESLTISEIFRNVSTLLDMTRAASSKQKPGAAHSRKLPVQDF
jgi:hypothetical protein